MKTLLSIFVFFSFFCVSAQISQDTLSIYFEFNKSSLGATALNQLEDFNSSEHGPIIQIVAHCDTSGTVDYNKELAQSRLDAVVPEIDSTAQTTIAEGESISAQASNYDPQLFRRVDIIYYSKDPAKLTLKEKVQAFTSDSTATKIFIDLNIVFYPGEARIKPQSAQDVQDLYKILRNNKNLHVHIHGHVCCGHNYVLSKNRAYAIYNYMLERSISYKRMKYTGHSNSQPKVWPEDTAEAKDANRRVSLEFTKH